MKINVAVFFGCASVEHEVSIISGVQAMQNLDRDKYEVVPIYVTKNGEMLTGEALFNMDSYKDIPSLYKICEEVVLEKENGVAVMKTIRKKFLKRSDPVRIDIALPVVHGTNSEDGTLAGYFELLGIPYAGCDVLSSSVGMDKNIFKRTIAADDIPILKGATFTAKMWIDDKTAVGSCIKEKIGYPIIVKPVNLGSSVGISKVESEEDLENAISLAFSFTDTLLVERAITNLREINCSVLGDRDHCEASTCEEPIMKDAILSYEDKYMSGSKSSKFSSGSKGMTSLQRKLPADISEEKMEEIQELAIRTFRSLGCLGVVRIDFLMDCDDNDKVYVNEINTIPGSLAFYLWEASGLPYTKLLDRIIELGFKRARTRSNLMFTIETNLLSLAGGSFGAKGSKN